MLTTSRQTITRFVLAALCVLAVFGIASTANAEAITSFSVDIQINQDSSVSVAEEIQYDFEAESRHGIFRDIPVSYKTGTSNRRIFIEVEEVLQDGDPVQYQVSQEEGNQRIRIGDPNETITGTHTYEISYNVRGALNFFDDGTAELYWNVVGDEWEVPINSAQASVSLPGPGSVSTDELTVRCFAGSVGATSSCGQLQKTASPLGLTASSQNIRTGEAMTAVLNFPAELVNKPAFLSSLKWWLQANPFVLLPIITLILSFLAWWRWGKDPEGRGVIVPHYEPPEDLKPILVGSLVDGTVHGRDITAGILYLAEQGFIEIERTEERSFILSDHDYILRKNRSFEDIEDTTYQYLAETIFADASKGVGKQFTGNLIKRIGPQLLLVLLLIFFTIFGGGFGAFASIVPGQHGVYILVGILIAVTWGASWWYKNKYDGSFAINVLGSREDESATTDQRPAVYISELAQSQTYQKTIKKLKKDVMKDMRNRGWFEPKNKIVGWGFWTITVVGYLLFQFGGGYFGVVGVFSIVATVVIAGGFSALMKRKTKEGAVLQEKLIGFKEFLSMTQKERLDFHNAPERSPKEFMQYLPYAIALEVEEKWAEQFKDISMPPPAWYRGTSGFAAASLADDFGTFSDNYSQAAGGGSGVSGGTAGGGMGGGGGGSW